MTKQELENKIDEMTKELQRLNVIVATMPDHSLLGSDRD